MPVSFGNPHQITANSTHYSHFLPKIALADEEIKVTEMTKKTDRYSSGAKLVRLTFS